jgi:crotonobetainyl-CoA:carnitine CoA-transferase CaiB-like acyl-CoA transferase
MFLSVSPKAQHSGDAVHRKANPLLNSYQCKDGHSILIPAPSERAWPAHCAGLGLEALASDPRFQDFEARCANRVA